MHATLFYIASALTAIWGISHLMPTKNVVKGFGDISQDNRHIVAMEWITEGVMLIFIGALVALVTIIDNASTVALGVYWGCAAVLIVMSIVSLFTGFKIKFLPFRLCPVIFTTSAILIILGILI